MLLKGIAARRRKSRSAADAATKDELATKEHKELINNINSYPCVPCVLLWQKSCFGDRGAKTQRGRATAKTTMEDGKAGGGRGMIGRGIDKHIARLFLDRLLLDVWDADHDKTGAATDYTP